MDEVFQLDLAQEVEHLLRAADGERGDDDVAAAVERTLQHCGEGAGVVEAHLFVEPVAVGGFDHQVVRMGHLLGVFDDGLIGVAHIAAEDDFPGLPLLLQPHLDTGGAQQVPHIRKPDFNALPHVNQLAVVALAEAGDGADGIV